MPSSRSTTGPVEPLPSDNVQATIPMKGSGAGDTSPTHPVAVGAAAERLRLQPSDRPGDLGRLGGFRILRVLGRGGMGMVYVGLDETLDRRLAIKVMNPGDIDAHTRERFLREARAAAALHNDYIVPVYQVGEDDGTPFIVMPLLEGETLADRLHREGRLSVRDALRVARETLTGLAAAHDVGLVHRDIKPGNLFLEGNRRRVRILDFGVAHKRTANDRLTKNGFVVGTPSYMSPEQAHGRELDGRADLFSVGAVLYECLLGVRPFPGDDVMSVLTGLVSVEPDRPSEVDPAIPDEVADLCMALLAKQRDDRPPSAREAGRRVLALERALARGSATVPVAAAPTPAPVAEIDEDPILVDDLPPRPRTRRRKKASLWGTEWKVAGAVVAAVALIAVGVVGGLMASKEPPPAPTMAPAAKSKAVETPKEPAPETVAPAETNPTVVAPETRPSDPPFLPPPPKFPPPKKGPFGPGGKY
ncbi:MAG TPA: serine/threonine-protein kinase [Gemmataceae bacterium]|nr:serine/threonine-protein kinase [Gemmataceae bacterium]